MYREAICCISFYNSIVINIYFIIRTKLALLCTLLCFFTLELADVSAGQSWVSVLKEQFDILGNVLNVSLAES